MALRAGQHDQQSVQVFGLAYALARQHLHQFFALLGLPVVVVDFGIDVTGADRVDVDAELAPFHRHGLGHLHHGRLAHAVGADLRQHLEAGHRCDVDDAAAGVGAGRRTLGTRQHAFADLLPDEESAAHIGVEDVVKVLFAHVLQPLRGADTAVVDQDVDRADLGLGVGHGGLDAVELGHVQFDHMGVAALAFNARAQLLELVDAAARQHHGGAGARQCLGKLGAQSAGSAGDEGHAAG